MKPAQGNTGISSAWATLPYAVASIALPTMSQAGIPPNISPLVRKFSEKAVVQHPGIIPIQAVGAVVNRQTEDEKTTRQHAVDWLRWLDFGESGTVDDIVQELEASSRKLIIAWKKVSSGLGPTHTLVEGIPTPQMLREVLLEAERKRDEKILSWWGKTKTRFTDFLGLMDDHKFLFDIIPQGDRYMSLFTGVVSCVVKASLEYKRICEGFSMAMSSITSDLARIRRTAEISDTIQMRRHVVRLYVGIFEMFCAYLEWFQRSSLKRFAASFDRNFYPKNVEPRLNEVKESIQEIEKEVTLVTQTRVNEMYQSPLWKDAAQQRQVANGSRQDDVLMSQERLSRFGETLGYSSIQSLDAVEQQTVYEQNLRAVSRNANLVTFVHVPTIAPTTPLPISKDVPDASHTEEETMRATGSASPYPMAEEDVDTYEPFMHRSDCERYMRDIFEQYIEDGRRDIPPNPQTSLSTLLPSEVVIGLQMWLQELKSTTIWVEGEVVERFGSGLSVAALRLVDASKEIGIPSISFICKQIYSFARSRSSSKGGRQFRLDAHEASLIALLYSVIAQLIYLLPDDPFPVNPVLERSNFERLDGTMASAPAALQIIRELALYAPPSLIWILDNIQFIESRTTMRYLREFVEFLREQERKTNEAHREEKKPYSKVCFTTDGNSWLLSRTIGVRERLDASRMAQRRPGRPFMGGADVSELGRRRR